MIFENREQAGKLLSEELSCFKGKSGVIVLAIPRGGVVVGYELARELGSELDVVVTKKIGAPENPELAIGALAEDGDPIFDQDLVRRLQVDEDYLRKAAGRIKKKISDYIDKFRSGRELDLEGKTVIITDDGVATGSTMEAALSWLNAKRNGDRAGKEGAKSSVKGPVRVILAVPTGARDSMRRLEKLADQTVCLDKPVWFSAVGQFFREFDQVDDERVKEILDRDL